MNRSLYTSIALLSLLVTGCSYPQLPDRAALVTTEFGGLIHSPSGVRFPSQVGDFIRGTTRIYDLKGDNVSIGYRAVGAEHSILASVSVEKSLPEQSAQAEFERCKQQFVKAHGQARLISEGPFSTGSNRTGHCAEYEYVGEFDGTRHCRLYLLSDIELWRVTYHATYRPNDDAAAKVNEFVRQFDSTK
jgi:hypothetical protein